MFPNGGNPYPGPAPDVRFGNASATGVNCTAASGTVCAVHVPPGSGTVQVTITTPGGTSEPAGLPYSYIPTPVITSIRPDFGVPTGGNTVSITGTGFITEEDAMTAMFGSAPANGTTCSSTTSCVAYSPPGSLGTVPLTIVNVWGDTSNAVPFTYKLPPPPTVEQISPNYGASAGYNLVTITGQNFTARQQFQLADGGMFDTVECSSSTTCTALTPPHSGNPNSAVPVGTIAVGQTEPPAPESRFFYYDPPQTNWWISDCYNWFPEYRLVRIAPHQWFCFQGAPFAYGSSEAPGVTRVQVHDTWDAPEHVQCSSEYQMCSARTPDLGTSWSDCLAWGGSQSVGIYVETPGGTTQVTSVHYQCWCQWDLCSSPIGGSSTMPPIDVPPHPSQPPPARRARRRRRAYRCHQTTRRRAVESSRSRRLRAA
jgi:hypothetical protein